MGPSFHLSTQFTMYLKKNPYSFEFRLGIPHRSFLLVTDFVQGCSWSDSCLRLFLPAKSFFVGDTPSPSDTAIHCI